MVQLKLYDGETGHVQVLHSRGNHHKASMRRQAARLNAAERTEGREIWVYLVSNAPANGR